MSKRSQRLVTFATAKNTSSSLNSTAEWVSEHSSHWQFPLLNEAQTSNNNYDDVLDIENMDFVCLNYNNQEENNDQSFNTSPVVVIEIPVLAGTSTANTSIETPNNI
ncbi:unnamed protein product [Macrosiphum euphorbiae]|uniref:Uncharacterized protein n=1 Tax=Macrosiphum euphorbiae TaxID=13131 RepID=A0AAV0VTM0_9HEMI|nr:unnamed protein product [Macrosiphum euphorbiae]